MIGLVDYDILHPNSNRFLIPNLEIMKLASYYRVEKNTFCRLISLDEENLDGYEKIFFFSELTPHPVIPPAFLRAKNVVYGGSALTNNKYIPFEDSIIDFTIARPFIYKELLKKKYQDGEKAATIYHVLDDSYYRMYAGENKLPIPPVEANKRVFIYDQDFFPPDWEKLIDQLIDRKPSSIVPVHPIICHTVKDFSTLRSKQKILKTADIILDFNIPLDEVGYLLKKYKLLFLSEINPSSPIFLTLGGDFQTSYQYFKDFIYKMNLLYSFWSINIPLKIKYQQPDRIHSDPLSNLSQLVENWTCGETRKTRLLDEKIRFRINKDLSEKIKEEKQALIKKHPDAKNLFNQNYTVLKERGYWRI